ncbi:hypothetical protein BK660_08765 [Pseudomonas brassicacearum]|uniref:Uncharacterized protein n=1 Tax=Pseudomonas brassicacearum TaxID=930166 RepID=A0A423I9P9_9PSED|nr:hypothetical protein BK660_08765 [Pseudomonas brassicacearum]
MSRSLGLREDQREGEVLATLVFELFPLDRVWSIREQARSHRGSSVDSNAVYTNDQTVGASLLAKGPVQPTPI